MLGLVLGVRPLILEWKLLLLEFFEDAYADQNFILRITISYGFSAPRLPLACFSLLCIMGQFQQICGWHQFWEIFFHQQEMLCYRKKINGKVDACP